MTFFLPGSVIFFTGAYMDLIQASWGKKIAKQVGFYCSLVTNRKTRFYSI